MNACRLALVLSLLALPAVGCDEKSDGEPDTKQTEEEQDTGTKQKEKQAKTVEPDPSKPATYGMSSVLSGFSVPQVVEKFESLVDETRAVSMVGRVDHRTVENDEGESKPAATTLFFSNPGFEIPVVRGSLTAGLDLPQRVHITQAEKPGTRVIFNAPAYISKRHDVGASLELFVGRIEEGLTDLVMNSTGTKPKGLPGSADLGIEKGAGIAERRSQNSVSDTFDRLIEVVESNDDLELTAKFDFEVAAKSFDKEIRPARLVVFGHPERQRKLIEKDLSIGLDLPHRLLVYGTKDGTVQVLFDEPSYLAERHGIDPESELVKETSAAVKRVIAKATEEIE